MLQKKKIRHNPGVENVKKDVGIVGTLPVCTLHACTLGHATYATQFSKLRLRGQMIDKNTYI